MLYESMFEFYKTKHEEDTVDWEVHHDSNKYIKSVYCQQSSGGHSSAVVHNKT